MNQHRLVDARKIAAAAWESERSRLPTWWRPIGYLAAALPVLLLVGLAWLRPDFNPPDAPDWKSVLAQADASEANGDFYEARHLYLKVDMISGWRRDWKGLAAAACGISRLDGARGTYSHASQILLRALITAQRQHSRQGIDTVARAFAALGEQKSAAMALAQIRSDWPTKTESDIESLIDGCAVPRRRKKIPITVK